MARAIKHFTDFLDAWASLVGIPPSRVSTELADVAKVAFQTAVSDMWNRGQWIEVCPRGEARFLGNKLTYPNNLAKTGSWTATAATLTADSVANPADGKVSASKMMETTATSAHKVVQTVATFFPSTGYTLSVYARANGRSNIQVACNDGVTAYSCFFNVTTGVVGTNSNFTTATIAQQANGFWLCRMTFTAAATATTSGTYTVSLSTDGSTLSYAGDTAKGAYVWGNLVQQTTNVPVQDSVIAWDQSGEDVIDAVFDVYSTSPFVSNYPRSLGYNITANGIQIINGTPLTYYANGVAQGSVYGAASANPAFVYYRKVCPLYAGDTFSATATYAVDDQIYYVNTAGDGDFWRCLVATTAGQDPDDTAASWERITFYDTFLQFAIYSAYADWLLGDGQADKAAGAMSIAQRKMDEQSDKLERLMEVTQPTKYSTHVTSRA